MVVMNRQAPLYNSYLWAYDFSEGKGKDRVLEAQCHYARSNIDTPNVNSLVSIISFLLAMQGSFEADLKNNSKTIPVYLTARLPNRISETSGKQMRNSEEQGICDASSF